MKRIFTIIAPVLLTATVWAQAPQTMSYQAVIRNTSDLLITNTTVGMRISILQGSAVGTEIYNETQNPLTNANGLVSIEFGGGLGFDTISWKHGPYFIKIETDPTGGSTYTISGTSEMLSVPFALYAKTAESLIGGINETDPVFIASPANGITGTNITDWNTAYGWGNHASAGYLTSFTETDPIFSASPANSVTSTNITDWNTAYGWGNHALAGYLTSFTETDPIFAASPANGITDTNITNWNTAYGWGNHALAGYLTSFTETDPIFAASSANGITDTNITNWNTAYAWGNHASAGYLTSFTELDPKVGVNTTSYLSKWNGTSLVSSNIFDNGTNVGIGTNLPTSMLHVKGTASPLMVMIENGGGNFKTGYGIKGAIQEWFIGQEGLANSGFCIVDVTNANATRLQIESTTGNVGIGTQSPGAKLEVNGQVKITGGTPGAGKVLTSDAAGLATWQTPAGGSTTRAVTSTSNYTVQAGDNVLISNSGSPITYTLPSAAVAGSGAVLFFYGLISSFSITSSQTIYDINGQAQTTLSGTYIVILASDGVNKWVQIH